MYCIALVRCVLVLRCGLAEVVWYPDVGNLMSLAFLFHYLLLNMFRMLIHPSSGACVLFVDVISWVVLLWFDVCWCYVVVWLGCCEARIRIPHHPSQTTT